MASALAIGVHPACRLSLHAKTNNFGFRPGPKPACTVAWYFGFKEKRIYIIYVAKIKTLTTCSVTAQLICAFFFFFFFFFFAYASRLVSCVVPRGLTMFTSYQRTVSM